MGAGLPAELRRNGGIGALGSGSFGAVASILKIGTALAAPPMGVAGWWKFELSPRVPRLFPIGVGNSVKRKTKIIIGVIVLLLAAGGSFAGYLLHSSGNCHGANGAGCAAGSDRAGDRIGRD